jgi:hypothetical protein
MPDDLIMCAVASLPESERERSLDALAAYTGELATMHQHAARGVRVAPHWRDPESALRAEASRLEDLADVAAVVFTASADSWALRRSVAGLE